ncbi:hypothetical protein FQN50_006771 [Emmonsiellopsis sp. PD_5]|nr:hypothetical protein FQN50_006771 [Emmonsiellopsis sp. PD_5]
MGSYDTYKTLILFFSPLILRKTISLYRALRTAIRTRPPPRPLPTQASYALNLLFATSFLFLLLSLPISPYSFQPNIFTLTSSRLTTSTDLLFTRLARLRPNTLLTPTDIALKAKLTSPALRKIYLRFGPDTLLNCPFCSLDSETSWLIYYLPLTALLPHFLHLLITGLATSHPLTGPDASRWRKTFTWAALALLTLDITLITFYNPSKHGTGPSGGNTTNNTPANPTEIPRSFHNRLTLLRYLALSLFDACAAGLIYLSATNRFFYTPPTAAEQVETLVRDLVGVVAGVAGKLHAVSVVRNATVRDRGLKGREDGYWRAVVAMEGSGDGEGGAGGSVWEEEEVVRAMKRVMERRGKGEGGGGGVDLARVGVEAGNYVEGVTRGLDESDGEGEGEGEGGM